jgi:hypothetical protein
MTHLKAMGNKSFPMVLITKDNLQAGLRMEREDIFQIQECMKDNLGKASSMVRAVLRMPIIGNI